MLPSLTLPRFDTSALATVTTTALHDEVVALIRVPSGAMRLRSIGIVAAKKIDRLSHRLQVVWPDTTSVATQVIELEALGDRPNHEFVDGPVGCTTRWAVEKAVALLVPRAKPLPATVVDCDLVSEAVHHGPHPPAAPNFCARPASSCAA